MIHCLALLLPRTTPAALPVGGAAAISLAVGIAIARWPRNAGWAEWVRGARALRQQRPEPVPNAERILSRLGALFPAQLRSALDRALRSAGLTVNADRYLGATVVGFALISAALAVVSALGLVPAALSAITLLLLPAALGWRLFHGVVARRQAVAAQLPMLVDLMSLEQSGGGVGARRAMELVVARASGPAADILRECLSRSAIPGSPPLDVQIEAAAQATGLPTIGALGVVVRLQRLEGISTGTPLGNLARSLRDRQRDELTAAGRRALVTMLLPVAACILLPFILIVLYPALDRLSQVFS